MPLKARKKVLAAPSFFCYYFTLSYIGFFKLGLIVLNGFFIALHFVLYS